MGIEIPALPTRTGQLVSHSTMYGARQLWARRRKRRLDAVQSRSPSAGIPRAARTASGAAARRRYRRRKRPLDAVTPFQQGRGENRLLGRTVTPLYSAVFAPLPLKRRRGGNRKSAAGPYHDLALFNRFRPLGAPLPHKQEGAAPLDAVRLFGLLGPRRRSKPPANWRARPVTWQPEAHNAATRAYDAGVIVLL